MSGLLTLQAAKRRPQTPDVAAHASSCRHPSGRCCDEAAHACRGARGRARVGAFLRVAQGPMCQISRRQPACAESRAARRIARGRSRAHRLRPGPTRHLRTQLHHGFGDRQRGAIPPPPTPEHPDRRPGRSRGFRKVTPRMADIELDASGGPALRGRLMEVRHRRPEVHSKNIFMHPGPENGAHCSGSDENGSQFVRSFANPRVHSPPLPPPSLLFRPRLLSWPPLP